MGGGDADEGTEREKELEFSQTPKPRPFFSHTPRALVLSHLCPGQMGGVVCTPPWVRPC